MRNGKAAPLRVLAVAALGAVVGASNLHIYAAMRGQTLDEFQKTRNAQVTYGVGGNDPAKNAFDQPKA